jgi:hypothetical protein
MANKVAYGRKLLNAGVSGILRRGQTAVQEPSFFLILVKSAPVTAELAVVSACLGFLLSRRLHRRRRLASSIAYAALGMFVGLTWKTRSVSASRVHSALKEIAQVRDEHWLEMNPIDYG